MRVCVRVRPTGADMRKSLHVVDSQMLIFDPSSSQDAPAEPHASVKRLKDIPYRFDAVFGESATQRQVYEGALSGIVDAVLKGINATVFAYGATGAGKTFTICGTSEQAGCMPLAMQELFARIHSMNNDRFIDISVSYLEVYNEMVRDLLAGDDATLDVREDSQGRVVVAGLSQHSPRTSEQVMELLERGNLNRTKSATKANQDSSRSHAVFQINIQQRDRASGIDTEVTTATLTLCDLAGSERASVTENRGHQLREGANINRSLLALGNCINALCDASKRGQHIPYRDSKLTRLLKFSLGGNCRTVMIANVSPAWIHYEETHNTLKYASRATQIRLTVEKNTVSVHHHIAQYVQLIDELEKQVSALRAKLSRYENGEAAVSHSENVTKVKDSAFLSTWRESLMKQQELMEYALSVENMCSLFRHWIDIATEQDMTDQDWVLLLQETIKQLQQRSEALSDAIASALDELTKQRAEVEADLESRQSQIGKSVEDALKEYEAQFQRDFDALSNQRSKKQVEKWIALTRTSMTRLLKNTGVTPGMEMDEVMASYMEFAIQMIDEVDAGLKRSGESDMDRNEIDDTLELPPSQTNLTATKPLMNRRVSMLPQPKSAKKSIRGPAVVAVDRRQSMIPVMPSVTASQSGRRKSLLPVPTKTRRQTMAAATTSSANKTTQQPEHVSIPSVPSARRSMRLNKVAVQESCIFADEPKSAKKRKNATAETEDENEGVLSTSGTTVTPKPKRVMRLKADENMDVKSKNSSTPTPSKTAVNATLSEATSPDATPTQKSIKATTMAKQQTDENLSANATPKASSSDHHNQSSKNKEDTGAQQQQHQPILHSEVELREYVNRKVVNSPQIHSTPKRTKSSY